MSKKIALIGAGNIGGTMGYYISLSGLFNKVVLIDKNAGMASGKALDIMQSAALNKQSVMIKGSDNYQDIKSSDVIIITAGVARKPGMSRDDLFNINLSVMKEIGEQVAKYAPNAFVIVVTNPLDAMVYAFHKYSALPSNMIVGMAGVLDTSRFKSFLAEEMKISAQEISSFVLGGHGDSMVPMLNYTSIAGIPLKTCIEMGMILQEKVEAIIERTQNGGAEIISLLQTGSAYYAPAASALEIAKAYINGENRILPCAAYLSGEYGFQDLFVGVPVVLGKKGVEKVLELPLSFEEKELFAQSVEAVKTLVENI